MIETSGRKFLENLWPFLPANLVTSLASGTFMWENIPTIWMAICHSFTLQLKGSRKLRARGWSAHRRWVILVVTFKYQIFGRVFKKEIQIKVSGLSISWKYPHRATNLTAVILNNPPCYPWVPRLRYHPVTRRTFNQSWRERTRMDL